MSQRCIVCHKDIEEDGYGELIHAESGLYGVYDRDGTLTHVARV